MNEIYWLLLLLTNFIIILIAFKLWGKTGLYVWAGVSIILANIQVIKTIEIYGMVATLGNIVYASSFLITDILSEIYGKKDSRRAVWIGFFSMVSATLLMQLCLEFVPHQSDFAHNSLNTIFSIMPRIMIASLSGYLISNLHDVWSFHFWKKFFSSRKTLWIRNNLSTMVSQLIDSVVFCFIAFWGVFELNIFIDILITTYLLKWIVAALDTPFIYIARNIKRLSE